ncbi:MAG TPA: hypothetical protein VFM96_02410 [Gaiellaceae bacterium]|nr:hypothetical protein [Gaiellaceae bacterium]
MTIELAVTPRGPYSLALSARIAGDGTRTFRDGVLTQALAIDGNVELTAARQSPNGTVTIRAESAAGADRMRWILALDDDHSGFLARTREDALLARASRELRGLRPVRVSTVAHALLRAFCGQLIEARRARQLERKIVRTLCASAANGLHVAPTTTDLAALAPSRLRALGLHARRAAALVSICRSFELERLHDQPSDVVAARLGRERGLGPWSVGIVFLEGLGRYDRGLVGDLGLIKLLRTQLGREVDGAETAALLAPYGEWAGLASVYLLAGYGRGLIPLDVAHAA